LRSEEIEIVNGTHKKRYVGSASPYVGNYFIFLHRAEDIHPIKIQFRDRETPLKSKLVRSFTDGVWREKVYLNPTLLQRKWIDYRFRDRFIPSVSYDNVLPLELTHSLVNPVDGECAVRIRSTDKMYRNVLFTLRAGNNEVVFKRALRSIPLRTDISLSFSGMKPGMYGISLFTEDREYRKGPIIFFDERKFLDNRHRNDPVFDAIQAHLDRKRHPATLFCSYCNSRCSPLEPVLSEGFEHKNYIPVKEYIDIEHLGMDYIRDFIMRMDHPMSYRRGFVHLLNMLRLASAEDEITIVTNLFKDDPPFAYFVTDRLFLFNMIPIMEDRELQNILNRIDDELLASALVGQNPELVRKVMRNISRRRAAGIEGEMRLKPRRFDGSSSRKEMHRIIRSFFEERFGRELRISTGTTLLYREEGLHAFFLDDPVTESSFGRVSHHSGSFIFFTGSDIFEILTPPSPTPSIHGHEERCIPYDMETFLNDIFTVYGFTESAVYLSSNFGIRFGLIHVYNWTDSTEDSRRFENLAKGTVIPLGVSTSAVVLTIGAIDARGMPCEQVIRLKSKGGA
jgi:hypothetical protein